VPLLKHWVPCPFRLSPFHRQVSSDGVLPVGRRVSL
jgi:hypothetical protein